MALAMCTNGLSLGWFAIGCGRASWIALFESVPRIAAAALSIWPILSTRQLSWYPALLAMATLTGILAFHQRLLGKWLPGVGADYFRILRERETWDLHASGVEVLTSAFTSAPVPIASRVATLSGAAALGSGDRLFRYSQFAIFALSNALQEWALGSAASVRERRRSLALVMHLALGLGGGFALAVFGSASTRLLFGEAVAADGEIVRWYALAFLMASLTSGLTKLVLIPQGRSATVLFANLTAASVGLALMLWRGIADGAAGVALGYCVSETLVALILAAFGARLLTEAHSS
jgi:PST family polysaccharide transporter